MLAEYGLVPKLALQAVLPVRMLVTHTRYTDLQGNPITLDYENIHHRDETLVGLGDAQLLLHGSHRFGEVLVGGRLGMSFPTGRVHEDPYRLGAEGRRHQHVQFGTGTFDPMLGVDASLPLGTTTFSIFSQAQLPLYEGPKDFRAGARLLSGVSVSQTLADRGPSLRLGGVLLQEWAERWHGEIPTEEGNQGRTDVFVGPGVTLPFGTDWSASADVRFRVWGEAKNAQLELPVLLELSLGKLFHLESGTHVDEADAAAGPAGDVTDVVRAGELQPLLPVRGKWTVFDFWAEWCEACRTLDAELRELARRNHRLAVRRVNIVDFDSPIAQKELRGVSELPRLRIVDPNGRTVFEASGEAEPLLDQVRARVGE